MFAYVLEETLSRLSVEQIRMEKVVSRTKAGQKVSQPDRKGVENPSVKHFSPEKRKRFI
jgi:hypothetical protein